MTPKEIDSGYDSRSRALLPMILTAADKLISCPSLDLVYRSLVESARDALGLERARLYIFSPDHKEVLRTYGTNMQHEVVHESAVPLPINEFWQSLFKIRYSREERWILRE